jgi:hypothetical protein
MSSITTIQSSDLITDSRSIINGNFSALNNEKIETSTLSTDSTFASASDLKIPSQLAVKNYVDSGGNQNASEIQRGLVEEATDGEMTSRSASGATGAPLFVTPTKLGTFLISLAPIPRVYTAGATWTKPANLKYIVAEAQGAGGGGSGVTGSSDAGGPGGGSGGYARKLIAASSLDATETVTVGTGGTGSATTGGNGTASSFGAHITGNGGNGDGGVGGTATGGDINITGGKGHTSSATRTSGAGANSILGIGGASVSGAPIAGVAGTGYGSGGSGGSQNTSSSSDIGGNGANGVVIVTEYYV